MLAFWTNRVSDVVLAFEVVTLRNSTPKTQQLLRRNLGDCFFSFLREIMHEIPELVLAVWKLWLTARMKTYLVLEVASNCWQCNIICNYTFMLAVLSEGLVIYQQLERCIHNSVRFHWAVCQLKPKRDVFLVVAALLVPRIQLQAPENKSIQSTMDLRMF